jgi:hypothetical protein
MATTAAAIAPFGDQLLAMVDQQLDLPGGLVVLGDWESGLA